MTLKTYPSYKSYLFLLISAAAIFLLISPNLALAAPMPFKEITPTGTFADKLQPFKFEMQGCSDLGGDTPYIRVYGEGATSAFQAFFGQVNTDESGLFDADTSETLYSLNPIISANSSNGETIKIVKLGVQTCKDNSQVAVRITPKSDPSKARTFGNPINQQTSTPTTKTLHSVDKTFDIELESCLNGEFTTMEIDGVIYIFGSTNDLKDADGKPREFTDEKSVPHPSDPARTLKIRVQKCLSGSAPAYKLKKVDPPSGTPPGGTTDSDRQLGAEKGGVVPLCNPALPPNTPYDANDKTLSPDKIPCGVNKFIELLQNLIKYLSLIVIPIAVLMIGWGGFQIMTSAGSEEKFGAGRKAIITALTGIAIILVSYVIIKFVFDALGVTPEFRGTLFN